MFPTRQAVMPPPNDAPALRREIHVIESCPQELCLSDMLADVLSEARREYAWKAETAAESQEMIIHLEEETERRLKNLDGVNAHWIVQEVSRWGGNNRKAIRAIASASSEQKLELADLIDQLLTPSSSQDALRALTNQRGLSLVMASKIYRFCCLQIGAALDRHSSYFFNSLSLRVEAGEPRYCTQFKREWANGKRRASRLAVYTDSKCDANLNEYCATYLPLLKAIANALNSQRGGFPCATSGVIRPWRPTDVEMAAYFWWSRTVTEFR